MNSQQPKKVKPNKFDASEMLATIIRAEGAHTEARKAIEAMLFWADKFCDASPIDPMEDDSVPDTISLFGRPVPKRGNKEIKRLQLSVNGSWKALHSGIVNWDNVLLKLSDGEPTQTTGLDTDHIEKLSCLGFAPHPFKSLGAFPAADPVNAAAQASRELYDNSIGLVNCLFNSGIADFTLFSHDVGDPERFSRHVKQSVWELRHEFDDIARQLLLMQESHGGKKGKNAQEANKLAKKRKRATDRIQRGKLILNPLAMFRESNPDASLPDAARHLVKIKVSPSFDTAKKYLQRAVKAQLIPKFPEGAAGRPLGGQIAE